MGSDARWDLNKKSGDDVLERCQLHMDVKLDEGLGNKLHDIPLCVGDPLSTNIPQTAGARKCVEGVSKATDGI